MFSSEELAVVREAWALRIVEGDRPVWFTIIDDGLPAAHRLTALGVLERRWMTTDDLGDLVYRLSDQALTLLASQLEWN